MKHRNIYTPSPQQHIRYFKRRISIFQRWLSKIMRTNKQYFFMSLLSCLFVVMIQPAVKGQTTLAHDAFRFNIWSITQGQNGFNGVDLISAEISNLPGAYDMSPCNASTILKETLSCEYFDNDGINTVDCTLTNLAPILDAINHYQNATVDQMMHFDSTEVYPITVKLTRKPESWGSINGDPPVYDVRLVIQYLEEGSNFKDSLLFEVPWDPAESPADNFSKVFNFSMPTGTTLGVITIYLTPANGYLVGYMNAPFFASGIVVEEVDTIATSKVPKRPEIVIDPPPGDASSLEYATTTSYCRTNSTTVDMAGGMNSSFETKLGFEGTVGIGVNLEVDLSLDFTAGYNIEYSTTSSNEVEKCMTINQSTIITNPDSLIGVPLEDRLLYIGYGATRYWGMFRKVRVNDQTCKPELDEQAGLAYYDNDFKPFKMKRSEILSDMELLRIDTGNVSLDTMIRATAYRQLKAWTEVLDENDDAINNALANGNPETEIFNLNSMKTVSTTMDVSETETYDTGVSVGADFGVNYTVEVGGNGFGGSTEFTYNTTRSAGSSNGVSTSNFLSYTLHDNDDGDNFVVDVYTNPLYGTPFFVLDDTSITSCPYGGGVQRNQPAAEWDVTDPASIRNIYVWDIDDSNADGLISVNFEAHNLSAEVRDYNLEVDNNLNPGATVSAGGIPLTNNNPITITNISAGGSKSVNITIQPNVANPDGLYSDLEFKLYPTCADGDSPTSVEVDKILLTANFAPDNDKDGILNSADLCPDDADTALDFDGVNDFISVPHNNIFNVNNGDFTFQAWVNPSSSGYKTIVSKGHGGDANTAYVFGILADTDPNSPGKLGLFLGNSFIGDWTYSNTSISQNVWTHVAVTVSNSGPNPEAIFYINGIEDGTDSYPLTAPYSTDTTPFYIGRQGDSCNCNYFEGKIDEVVVWSKQLTASELLSSIAAPNPLALSGLVASYKMNDGIPACGTNFNVLPTLAYDSGPNAANGGLANFAFIDCTSNWTIGRNTDFDNDGIGDSCDTDYSGCLPDYANGNSLIGNQNGTISYIAGGLIQSTQTIQTGADVEYNAGTAIEMNPNFQVQNGAVFHAFIDGCGS